MASTYIKFYRETGPYGEFCNFYPCEIVYDGKSYPTSEHLYQALKYIYKKSPIINVDYAEEIRNASTPNISKILANQNISYKYSWQQRISDNIIKYQQLGIKPRPDWEKAKLHIMKTVLFLKFCSNRYCWEILVKTGENDLQEDSPYDNFWGIGKNGKGENMLGKLLVQVRESLKNLSQHDINDFFHMEERRLKAIEKKSYDNNDSMFVEKDKII
jgi:ribA/ribD-fused uncharacterized protein